MKILTKEELDFILSEHKRWLHDEGGGRANLSGANLHRTNLSDADLRGANLHRANLSGANLHRTNLSGANLYDADLRGANLCDADLCDADLRGADLCDADLCGADLRGANLYDADLRGANLRGADLTPIKRDYFDVLIKGISELMILKRSIINGTIDGSTYDGPCACLCGTLEKTENENVKKIIYNQRDSSRPIERFFLGIKKGDTPETSQFSKLALDWLNEFIETIRPYIKEGVLDV